MAPRRLVIKLGGSTLGQHDTTLEDLVWLQRQHETQAVVVHGGGKAITEWLDRMKVPTQFSNGLRVTDEQSIGVVIAVLAGLVNKQLVASINALGGRAIGLCGADAGILRAKIKDPALGFVGEPSKVDSAVLEGILALGLLPVLAPIGILETGEGTDSTLLNINADTTAAAIGGAMRAGDLLFLTDVPGVNGADGKVIPRLTRAKAMDLIAAGVISGGMVPKVQACLQALDRVPATYVLDGRRPHALRQFLAGEQAGTCIEADSSPQRRRGE